MLIENSLCSCVVYLLINLVCLYVAIQMDMVYQQKTHNRKERIMKHETRKKCSKTLLVFLVFALGLIFSGCVFDPSGFKPADADIIDADVDADIDGDIDGDVDGDIDEEICGNGIDDDDDGLTDCADVEDCAGYQDPSGFECTDSGERKEIDCSDGVDNDGDWAIDCEDPDCEGDPACPPNPEDICDNGIDDDGNGDTDCADSACIGSVGPDGVVCEAVETTCDDGGDNDGDGLTDCDDPDCDADPACLPTTETSCTDNVDNDVDGLTDCEDPDCAHFTDGLIACEYGMKWEIDCSDGIDNDGDGLTDCDDPYCRELPACGGVQEICNNGLDDDTNGYIDCMDAQCELDSRCTPFTEPGTGNPGALCNTGLPAPCASGRESMLSFTCKPMDISCY